VNITLETDYAIRIVYCVAKQNKRVDAKTIAESSGVTLRFSLKILRKLVASGIIKSYKGTKGGYELAKDPGQISLKDVIETIEGPYMLNKCLNNQFNCTQVKCGECRVQSIFEDISKDVNAKLAKVSFADLLK